MLAGTAFSQTETATLSGRITDQQGRVVPAAVVEVTNTNTNVTVNAESNSVGLYIVSNLIPGPYRLVIRKEGFSEVVKTGLTLHVQDAVEQNFELRIGSLAQSVQVTAEAPTLRTTDAQEGLVIDNRRIMELPQYNRDPLAFAQLAPNVNGANTETSWGSDFRINGGRTNEAEYYLDGQAVTTGYYHDIPASMPSKEALDEFKVITNGLSAEYGRLSGGAVVLNTRSGTNNYHGEVYEFFKNDALNATDWNSNRLGVPKAPFHDNVFGFTFGGPLTLPKVYHGKDKTFFFLNFEGDRHSSGSYSNLMSIPTAAERTGDFSQSILHGVPVQIFDPATGVLVNGGVQRSPFANEKIDPKRFNPLAVIYQSYYPASPNTTPTPGTSDQNNYTYGLTSPSHTNSWTGRLDHNWSSSHTTHFTLSEYDFSTSTTQPIVMLPSSENFTTSYTIGVSHNWVVNPTTVVTFRLGGIRDRVFSGSVTKVDDSSWNLPWNVVDLLGGTNNGRTVSISGLSALGGGSVDDIRDTSYQGGVSLQKIHGRHTFKAGFELRRYYSNEYQGGNFSEATDPNVTSESPTTAAVNGDIYASFLLGIPTWGAGDQYTGPASLQSYQGAYFQDDLKLTKKLTINAGLRWDYEPPRVERYNRETFWDPKYTWNISPDAGWSWSAVEAAAGISNLPEPIWMSKGIHGRVAEMGTPQYPGRTLEPNEPYHFGPRIGIAYQLNPKTVIRVGYGLVWMTKTGNYFLGAARFNLGYGDAALLPNWSEGLVYSNSFDVPMPGNEGFVPYTRDITALNNSVMGNWWVSETNLFSPGHEHNELLTIQRQLGSGRNTWLLEVGYNGSEGRSLPNWVGVGYHVLPDAYDKIGYLGSHLETPVPNPFNSIIPAGSSRSGAYIPLGQVYEQMPLWQQISTTGDPIGVSNYNSGFMQVEHRFAHGFGFLANYTYGLLMEDCGGVDFNSPGSRYNVQGGLPWGKDLYSVSTSDFRNKLIFNYSVDLPFGRGHKFLTAPGSLGGKVLDKVVGGWVAAGVTTFHSGVPLSITGSNALWWDIGQASNGMSERPIYNNNNFNNHVSGHRSLIGAANYEPYMNRSSFRLCQFTPTQAEIGNVPWAMRDLVSPGFSQWDFSLMKNFYLGKETRYFQFRVEAQNLFNHMNAGAPDGNITDGNFGMINYQNGNPRYMMIAAKIYF
jgi:hypothetical protein